MLAAHVVAGASFAELYAVKSTVAAPRGSHIEIKRCMNRQTKEDCAVKLINAKHMDFNEAALCQEILILKKMAELPASDGRVTGFIALFYSEVLHQYQLVVQHLKTGEPLFDCITHNWYKVAHTWDSRPYEEEDASRIFRSLVKSVAVLHGVVCSPQYLCAPVS